MSLPENIQYIALKAHSCARALDDLAPVLRQSPTEALWHKHDKFETEHIRLLQELIMAIENTRAKQTGNVINFSLESLLREAEEALDYYDCK